MEAFKKTSSNSELITLRLITSRLKEKVELQSLSSLSPESVGAGGSGSSTAQERAWGEGRKPGEKEEREREHFPKGPETLPPFWAGLHPCGRSLGDPTVSALAGPHP